MTTEPSDLDGSGSAAISGDLLPRFGARLLDSLIVAVVGGLIGYAFDYGTGWLLLQALLVFAYFVVLDVSQGTTLGKRLLGLSVTGPDGGKPTVQQAAVREAFTVVGAIPFAGPLLSLAAWIVIAVTINASSTNQGLHDELAGGTRVVKG